MSSIIPVNPFRCRIWAHHDRLDEYVTQETCRAEIESFLKHGQFVPALGRALRNDPSHDYEIICGARRLFIARHINKPLLLELRDLSDHDAIIAMDVENRQRLDISPYERGVSYARWLRGAHFKSQDDIARALKLSASQVSRLLKLARLPSVVVDAFDSPASICEGWGIELMDGLDDPEKRPSIVRKARAIARVVPRPPAREVYRRLRAATACGRKMKPAVHDDVIKDARGDPLFRIRHQVQSIAIVLPIEHASTRSMEEIRDALVAILSRGSAREASRTRRRDLVASPSQP
jgi:ParB family transcriptional regulator, chromosome partitioning protein